MKKFLGVICCILIGLLAVSAIAYGQNESTQTSTVVTTPPPPLYSTRALEDILLAVVIIVIIPILVFAWYNKYALKAVLDANEKMVTEKNEKGEPIIKRELVTEVLKAIVPPEPLGLPNGSVRAIIAIVGISIFAYAIFAFADYRKELLSALVSLLSAVIGFYFGARATEEVRGEKKKPNE